MSTPDDTSNRNETLAVVTALAAAAATVLLAVVVAALLSSAPAGTGGTDPAPGCAEWSDGCMVCRRTAQGPACSTPGIACTRGAVQCQSRS